MFEFFTSIIEPGDASANAIMLDVGAQRGQFSRRFAAIGFDVRAFEASPVNYAELVGIVSGIENIRPENVAVSDVDGEEVKFFYSEEFIGINSLMVNSDHLSQEKFALVPAVRLDTYLGADAPRVDVIKTDIEGADLLALRSFDFEQSQPRLVLSEYGGRSTPFGYAVGDLVAFMVSHGYEAWVSDFASGSGLPFSAKTGEQSTVELRYFGRFEECPNPNWGDVVFFRSNDRKRMVQHIDQYDLGRATVRLER